MFFLVSRFAAKMEKIAICVDLAKPKKLVGLVQWDARKNYPGHSGVLPEVCTVPTSKVGFLARWLEDLPLSYSVASLGRTI